MDYIYKKINYSNRNELTSELINQMYSIDKIFYTSKKVYVEVIKDYLRSKKYNFYFVINTKDNHLVGSAFGEITKNNSFFLDKLFINPKDQKKLFGTKLLLRVISDLRVNHKITTISMLPRPITKKINRRITGNELLKIKIDGEIKEIKRQFKSYFKYTLHHHPNIPNMDIIKIEKNKKQKPILNKRR